MNMKFYLYILIFIISSGVLAESPLSPIKLNTPRNTMKIFMESMNAYKEGMDKNNSEKKEKIQTAIKCLNLKDISPILRQEQGREVAVFLKETIDRIIVFSEDFKEVPDEIITSYWVIPETEISIHAEEIDGRRVFLFTNITILNSREYFLKVKHLPYLAGSGNGANYSPPWKDQFTNPFSTHEILGLYLWQWVGLLLAGILSYIIKLVSKFLFEYSLKIAKKTINLWDDKIFLALSRPGGNILVIGFWFIFLYLAGIDGKSYIIITYILKILLGIYFIQFLNDFSEIVGSFYKLKINLSEDPGDHHLVPLFTKITKIALVSLGVMLSLQNLGINVISLMAGLGIGGLAIALAARDTASNLFGSLMILMDKPFKTGDFIIIGSTEGVVEEIGFRSTRIRSLSDSIISIPNSLIANSNIENMGSRRLKRTNFSFHISYDTPPPVIESFLEGIKNIILNNSDITKENLAIVLHKLGDPGIEIMINFYSTTEEWEEDLELRQTIYMEILRLSSLLNIKIVTQNSSFPMEKGSSENEELNLENLKKMAKSFSKNGTNSKPQGYGIFKHAYKEKT